MQVAGIVGGLGPEATIEYYRLIVGRYRSTKHDGSYPRFLINSVDMAIVLGLLGADDLRGLEDYLCAAIEQLSAAGAQFAALSSNTPHIVFRELKRRSPIPLISIVEVTCLAAQALGAHRLGLFGSRFTMQMGFYPDEFTPAGIALVVPTPSEQEYIHKKYIDELIRGVVRDETRDEFVRIAHRMKSDDGIDGLILGGTELPLILRGNTEIGVPLLDTTELHVEAIVRKIID